MTDLTADWIYVGALFLLLFAMEGIPSSEVRYAARTVILICAEAVCVIKTIMAARLRKAFKNGKAITCSAKIVLRFGHRWHNPSSCEHALARYSVNGKEVLGVMVCAVDRKLTRGECVSVYVNENAPRAFAFSGKQPRDAVLTYAVFGVLASLLLAVETILALNLI